MVKKELGSILLSLHFLNFQHSLLNLHHLLRFAPSKPFRLRPNPHYSYNSLCFHYSLFIIHSSMTRCPWLPPDKPLYVKYHDEEWGVASHDPRYLFEMICLEGAQAGLSWWTVLQKRERYRVVFHNFVPEIVAKMTDKQLEKLVYDPGIIRHRGKIFSVRDNARAWLALDNPVEWLWGFAPRKNKKRPRTMADYAARTRESDVLSKALKKAGFNFVGSTITYAFMQATGMVDDHAAGCMKSE
jgi:DNA-3-methyladenine glycosylase I